MNSKKSQICLREKKKYEFDRNLYSDFQIAATIGKSKFSVPQEHLSFEKTLIRERIEIMMKGVFSTHGPSRSG